MHPAERLILRVEELLTRAIPEAKTAAHRTLALNEEQSELPALIVTMGNDDPFNQLSTMETLGSLLSFAVSIIDQGADERATMRRLTDLRRRVHAALMAPGALGFGWAIEVGYQGAVAPVTDNNGTRIAKDLTTRWQIAYVMDRLDPDVSE